MALVEFGALVTSLKGSIGGWTFQRNRSGNIVRLKPRTTVNPTSKQTVIQSEFVSLIQGFQALTTAQKLLWDDFATLNTKENKFGFAKTLSGQNWYQSVNFQRERLGLARLLVPPANLLPEQIVAFDLTVNLSKIEISNIFPNDPTDTGILIATTTANTLLTDKQRSAFRETKVETGGPFGTIDITAQWEATHGINWPAGSDLDCISVGVEIVPVRGTTGITGTRIVKVNTGTASDLGIGEMAIGSTFVVR